MNDEFLPSVSTQFLIDSARTSELIHHYEKIGDSHIFIKKGTSPLHKRFSVLVDLEAAETPHDYAIAFALKFGFLPDLMNWWEQNKGYTEGGYSERLLKNKSDIEGEE
jgi:hypothetical protein